VTLVILSAAGLVNGSVLPADASLATQRGSCSHLVQTRNLYSIDTRISHSGWSLVNMRRLESNMPPLSAGAVRGLPDEVLNGGEIRGHPGDLFGTGGKENVLLIDSGVPAPLYP